MADWLEPLDPKSWEKRFKRSMSPQPGVGQQVMNTVRDLYPPRDEMEAAREARARMEQAAMNQVLARRAAGLPPLQDLPMPQLRPAGLLAPADGTAEDRQIQSGLLAASPQSMAEPPQGDAVPPASVAQSPASPTRPAETPAVKANPDDEDRAIRHQALYGGLLSLGAGLMGYGQDTRNTAPLMQGAMGFQQALQGAMEARVQAERMKQVRAQTALAEANAAKIQAQQQADARFTDRLAGAPGTGQVAQGDAQQPLDLTDQEKQYLMLIPDAKERAEAFRKLQEAKLISRMPAQGYRSNPDGSQTFIKGSNADPEVMARAAEAKRKMDEKAIPTAVTKGIQENMTALGEIDRAIAAIQGRPDSIGGPGATASTFVPGAQWWLNNKGDPEGVAVRSAVTAIGGKKLHDMSGAAVTVGEEQRLRGMIPSISDNAETAITKLNNLRNEYATSLRGTLEYYNAPNSGFRPYPVGEAPAQQQRQAPAGAPAPGQVIDGYRFKGGNPADKNSWERVQ